MQFKHTPDGPGSSSANDLQSRYGVLVSCNKCGGAHDLGISIVMASGPVEKQSIGDLFRGKTVPKNLADLSNNSVTCPTTGRQSTQKNNQKIFLVPANP